VNVLTTVHAEILEASQMPEAPAELEGATLVVTTKRVQLRESKEFAKLSDALDFAASLDSNKVRNVLLNVNLINAKRDKHGRLVQADYPWTVSYPKSNQSEVE
jgi:hypothetical protein